MACYWRRLHDLDQISFACRLVANSLHTFTICFGLTRLYRQEVDRLEKVIPALEKAGYSHIYSSGPRKKHGCIVAFKSDKYVKISDQTVFYDDEDLHSAGESERFRRGSSFKTRNIALIVGLNHIDSDQKIVVATTHLFWHPKYTYERAR